MFPSDSNKNDLSKEKPVKDAANFRMGIINYHGSVYFGSGYPAVSWEIVAKLYREFKNSREVLSEFEKERWRTEIGNYDKPQKQQTNI